MPALNEGLPIQAGNWQHLMDWLASLWTTVSKAADESRTATTVLAADAALTFQMAANTVYRIRGKVFFDTNAAGDFKYDLNGPAAANMVRFRRVDCIAGGTPAARAIDLGPVGSTSLAGAGTTGGYVEFDGIVQNGANAGPWSFRWAQDTSDAGFAIVRAGSFLEYQAVLP